MKKLKNQFACTKCKMWSSARRWRTFKRLYSFGHNVIYYVLHVNIYSSNIPQSFVKCMLCFHIIRLLKCSSCSIRQMHSGDYSEKDQYSIQVKDTSSFGHWMCNVHSVSFCYLFSFFTFSSTCFFFVELL